MANDLDEKGMTMEELIGHPYRGASRLDVPAKDPEVQDVSTAVAAKTAEVIANELCLNALGATYRSKTLNDLRRFCRGRSISWEQVVQAIPNVDEFLTKARALVVPVPYGITARGELILVDNRELMSTPESKLDPSRIVRVKLNLPA